MKDQIQNIKLDNPCDRTDIKRIASGQEYYCKICSKTVVDFRLKTKQELENKVLQTNDYVCGIFNRQQVSNKPRIPKFLAGILMTLGLNFIFEHSHAQKVDTLSTDNEENIQEDLVVGTFETMPVFKNGGQEGLQKFLSENLVYPDSLKKSGRVVIELTIDTSGVVTTKKLAKGFNEYADKEALRVCSLLIFTPGYRYGKPIETKIYLPIMFEIPADQKKPNR